MRKQKGSIPAEALFGELVHLSHQIRSVAVHKATLGTIRRQHVPRLAGDRWLPQCGDNETNATRGMASGRMVAAGFRGFTKHIDPVSLSFGVRDLEAPRLADEIECRSRSEAQEHEDTGRNER
jgi:hypothetical protein